MKHIEFKVPARNSSNVPSKDNFIQPVEFSPSGGNLVRTRWKIKPIAASLSLLLCLVALVIYFLFNARSLVVQTTPTFADVDIEGSFSLMIGSRYLLLSGEYTLNVSASGYHTTTQPLLVGKQQNQEVIVHLVKTPGILRLQTVPVHDITLLVDNKEIVKSKENFSLELAAGEHSINVGAARYLPQNITVNIGGMGKQQEVHVKLKPAWADVYFSSESEPVNVLIDGQLIGVTPLQTEILQGEHNVTFQRAGYDSQSKTINIVAEQSYQFNDIKLMAVGGWLQLQTKPTQANITLNGEFKGRSPLKVLLEPGKAHNIAIFKTGYKTLNQKITLGSGQQKPLSLNMKPLLGKVNIRTNPKDAQIYINNKMVGVGLKTLTLPAHNYNVEVRKEGYQTQYRKIIPRPGFAQSMDIRLLTNHQAKWEKVKLELITSAGQKLLLMQPYPFVMGASRREAGRRSNEILHSVDMKRAFYLSEKEVTNAQFRLFKESHSSGHVEGNSLDGDQQPVVKVTWEQAAAYCNWLSEQDSLPHFYQINNGKVQSVNYKSNGYRLPTEAEWVWSARIVKDQPPLKFPWGGNLPPSSNSGNYADSNSVAITGRAIAGYKDDYIATAPVGSFKANQHALFDMGGNVAEWINDYYGLSMKKGKNKGVDPTGPDIGEYRVIRGSSWSHGTVTELRFSYRDYGVKARNDLGFRLARYVE